MLTAALYVLSLCLIQNLINLTLFFLRVGGDGEVERAPLALLLHCS